MAVRALGVGQVVEVMVEEKVDATPISLGMIGGRTKGSQRRLQVKVVDYLQHASRWTTELLLDGADRRDHCVVKRGQEQVTLT